MKKLAISLILSFGCYLLSAQNLSTFYEELTAPDFVKAVEKSSGVCLLPLGILEKHGPHLPLGTDMFDSRMIASTAAAKEYCVVFPPYYFGQINEARHQPGTIAYSHEIIWNLLKETCEELSRNGFKKIIVVNGHGGNNDFLHYFCMSLLHSPKDYELVMFQADNHSATAAQIAKLRKTTTGGHADEMETSMMRVSRPELVKSSQVAASQSGADQDRLAGIPYQYTGIWWYAKYPNHYAGDASQSSVELGKLLINSRADELVKLIKSMKQSNKVRELEDEFYKKAADPLKTQQ